MSGSSMDGVDLAYCELTEQNSRWSYEILAAETVPYDAKWRNRLSQLYKQPAVIFAKTDAFYGRYLGELVSGFIQRHKVHADAVASHGHTIFHSPEEGFTSQIGHGAYIHATCGLPVISDFRTTDVALGGQGAPLVPIGDNLLFHSYAYCLNLGGFANISANINDTMHAFDIAPCNIILNRCARMLQMAYDHNGNMAAQGIVHDDLLNDLNALEFYHQPWPKSLNREWINTTLWPVTKDFSLSPQDKLATLCAHIATQIANAISLLQQKNPDSGNNLLVTGGGALNTYLVNELRKRTAIEVTVPDVNTVNFKEALIFALLGVLRLRNENNCLHSVTGAAQNNIGGALYGDFNKLLQLN